MRNAMLAVSFVGLAVLSSTSRAGVTLAATYKNAPENTAHILAVAGAQLDNSELVNLLRLEDLSAAPAESGFTITYPTSNTANVSWNLTGKNETLSAIYIFGGSNGADLYKVDLSQAVVGCA